MKDWTETAPASKTQKESDKSEHHTKQEVMQSPDKASSVNLEKGISANEEDKEELPKPTMENPTSPKLDEQSAPWSKREDKTLVNAVRAFHNAGFWRISKEIEGRSKHECQTRYFLLKELRRQKKEWTSNEVSLLQKSLRENPDLLDNVKSVSKKLPHKSSSKIKDKLHQMMKWSDRKKVVIRNQKKSKPKLVKELKKEIAKKVRFDFLYLINFLHNF